jgi:hypothetical protein
LLPAVLLLDLDGTIVGDVSPHTAEYAIFQDVLRRKFDTSWLVAALRCGLLRPGFARCMQYFSAHFPELEVFVYTASLAQWAAIIIRVIEEETGVCFNRPILSREDCLNGGNSKSFANVRHKVFRALRNKYPALTSCAGAGAGGEAMLQSCFLMVDNLPNVLPIDERHRLVTCPTYSWKGIHNILGRIPPSLLSANMGDIMNILQDNGLLPLKEHTPLLQQVHSSPVDANRCPMDLYALMASYSRHHARLAQHYLMQRSTYASDYFWTQFCRAIARSEFASRRRFDDVTLRAIMNTLAKQQQQQQRLQLVR